MKGLSRVGSKGKRRLEENLRALEIELSRGDLRLIDEAPPPGFAAETHYLEVAMHMVNRQEIAKMVSDQSALHEAK
jgi:hypothetical protein